MGEPTYRCCSPAARELCRCLMQRWRAIICKLAVCCALILTAGHHSSGDELIIMRPTAKTPREMVHRESNLMLPCS
jgi:hypothetical protein